MPSQRRPSAASPRLAAAFLLNTVLLSTALLLPASPAGAASWFTKGPQKGEQVEFTGIVSDNSGQPLEGVTVVLEATRDRFRMRSMSREVEDTFRISTTTDAQGGYTLKWSWNDFHNGFALLVGTPLRQMGKDLLYVLHKVDVTKRAKQGGPVITPMVVEDTTFLLNLRRFLASLKTDDERRTYQEIGRPDKIDAAPVAGATETAWWYFEAGRVYRFRSGTLDRVDTFDPVKAP